jgi:hypothetical protein
MLVLLYRILLCISASIGVLGISDSKFYEQSKQYRNAGEVINLQGKDCNIDSSQENILRAGRARSKLMKRSTKKLREAQLIKKANLRGEKPWSSVACTG